MTLKESSIPEVGYVPGRLALRDVLTKSLRAHAVLFAIVGIYCASVVLLGYLYGASDRVNLTLYNVAFVILIGGFCAFFICERAWRMAQKNPSGLFRAGSWLTVILGRLQVALPILLTLPVFFAAYNSAKSLIPVVHPFAWDSTFARLDEVIHGAQPWRLLHPILKYPVVTYAIDCIYQTWFLVVAAVVVWQASSVSKPELRYRFFLTYLLLWILLGSTLATFVSSAGPCYYEQVRGESGPYHELMDHLQTVNVRYPMHVLAEQEYLWGLHKNGSTYMVSGISAMPSMHVSMVVLFALVGWRAHRAVGISLTAFAVLTAVACVYLGWHYAVDAYIATLGTLAIWWAVGLLLRVGRTAKPAAIELGNNETQRREARQK